MNLPKQKTKWVCAFVLMMASCQTFASTTIESAIVKAKAYRQGIDAEFSMDYDKLNSKVPGNRKHADSAEPDYLVGITQEQAKVLSKRRKSYQAAELPSINYEALNKLLPPKNIDSTQGEKR